MDQPTLENFFKTIAHGNEIEETRTNSLQELTMDKCNIDEAVIPNVIEMMDNNSSLISLNFRQASVEFEHAFKPLLWAV